MSDRRTFLGNAAAAIVMTKITSLRSFGVATDGPETIDPAMSDREKAGLRGPVKQYTVETVTPGVQGDPEMTLSQTTEYDPDGRFLSTSIINPDGSKRVTRQTSYDADGRLTKTISGNGSEPDTVMDADFDNLCVLICSSRDASISRSRVTTRPLVT